MRLVERHIIKETSPLYKDLDSLCLLSKNLYNATLYAVKQHYFEHKEYLNYNAVNKIFTHSKQPDYTALPAKVSKMTQMKVDKSFKSFFSLLKNKDVKNKLPKYLPKDGRYVVEYCKQTLSLKEKGYIITTPQAKQNIPKLRIPTDKKNVQNVRIVPKINHYVIEIGYDVETVQLPDNGNYASIDLGINNLATVTSNVFKPFIINGKPLKSINQYYNKEVAKLQGVIDTTKKYTKEYVYFNRMKRFVIFKRNNKITDYLHKSSRILVNHLVSNNVTTLVIGYNKKWKQDINIGRVNNQKFVDIPYLKFIDMLKYKCKLSGIKVVVTEESYTSKCSFLDNETIKKHETYLGKRIKRGLFRTSKNVLVNADVNGSYNILKKYLLKQVAWNADLFADCVEVCSTPYKITIGYR